MQAGSTVSTIVWSAETMGVYDQGTLVFTSGVNDGVQVTIKSSSNEGQLFLMYPLDDVPSVGDSFTISAGCDHTMATCQAKFANLANFRGFPFVPPPETAY